MNTSRSPGAAGAGSRSVSSSSRRDPASSTSLQPSLDEELSQAAEAAQVQTRDAVASIGGDFQEAARSATTAVKQQAAQLASDVGHELSKAAQVQKTRGVEAIQGFSRAINAAAAELESQSPAIAQYVRDAAEKVKGLSNNIEGRDVNELMRAASKIARSQPLLFIGGALAAGFALSRFLKSGTDASDEQQRSPSNLSA
jgi:DNA-directed RNA polymerase beta' subunit